MSGRPAYTENAEKKAIHSYYTKIINLMPYLVYWVDESCNLQGFNTNFGKLLGIFSADECNYDPYLKLAKSLNLPKKNAEMFRIEDMQVIFSGQAKHNQNLLLPQNNNNEYIYYKINRDPILSDSGQVIGAVVVIMESAPLDDTVSEKNNIKINPLLSNKTRILIVEDNETAQKVESTLFINLNCDVDAVQSGAEAIKIFKPGKYSLVIMDIGLGDSSGYLLSRRFREMEANTEYHSIIIALTSYKPENVKSDCVFYKMEGVVGKPLTAIQATQIIDHFIHKKGNSIDGFS